MNVLFVCTGNICRSPLAEGILKAKFAIKNIPGKIDSAGFEAYHTGDAPDYRAQKIARFNGIDISGHNARMFSVRDFDHFDRIYVMDSYHYQNVMRLARNDHERQKVDYIMNVLNKGGNIPVPDPYYDGFHAFEQVFTQLETACEQISKEV